MMKRILAASAAVASLAALSAPAYALPSPSPQANVQVTGSVPATCSLGGLTDLNNTIVSLDNTSGSLAQSDGTVDNSVVKKVPLGAAIWCNGTGTTVTLNAKALRLVTASAIPSAPPSGFVNVVPYQVSTNFPGFSGQSLDTGVTVPGANAMVTVGAFVADTSTYIQLQADSSGSNKVIAGAYHGSITITVTPG
jgi:hypothetical protein